MSPDFAFFLCNGRLYSPSPYRLDAFMQRAAVDHARCVRAPTLYRLTWSSWTSTTENVHMKCGVRDRE
jgi:hypothetical protein